MLIATKLIRHNGKEYKPDEEITGKLTKEEKARLLELNAIKEIGTANQKQATDNEYKDLSDDELRTLLAEKGKTAPDGSDRTILINLLKN